MKRTLRINAKCADLCYAEFFVDGELQAESDGAAPSIKGLGGGDYVDFEIDLDTGKILRFISPTNEEVMNALGSEYDEEEEDEPNEWDIPNEELDASINKLLDNAEKDNDLKFS